MSRFRCRACGGTYRDESRDGTAYYHACPPLSRVERAAAGEDPLPEDTRAQERPGRRDENLAPAPTIDGEGRIVRPRSSARAEGRGREVVAED